MKIRREKANFKTLIIIDLTWSYLPVYRPLEDLPRETKTTADVNHNSAITASSHGPMKSAPPVVTSSSPSTSSNSVLSSFLYGMPMSSKPHPDGKLDFKGMSFLSLGKDRATGWTSGTDKMSIKDCVNHGKIWTCSPVGLAQR